MLPLVNRRFFRPLIQLLVVAQVLSLVPAIPAAATAESHATPAAAMPCAGHAPGTHDSQPCPCCPDGVEDMAACLTACAAVTGAVSAIALPLVRSVTGPVRVAVLIPAGDLSDPPLKPPPIV